MNIKIRKIKPDEWEDAMSLCWRTFKKYEAPVYPERGTESFLEFISDERLKKMYLIDEYKVFAAFDEDKIVGVISLRLRNHISLLFVDESYHRNGIGSSLVGYAAMVVKEEYNLNSLTVNASPYGEDFYHAVGFTDEDKLTEKDGILYTPMKYELK